MVWGASVISYYWLTGRARNQRPWLEMEQLRKFEPVGMVTHVVSLLASIPLALGVAGPTLSTMAPFINVALALILPAIMYRGMPVSRPASPCSLP